MQDRYTARARHSHIDGALRRLTQPKIERRTPGFVRQLRGSYMPRVNGVHTSNIPYLQSDILGAIPVQNFQGEVDPNCCFGTHLKDVVNISSNNTGFSCVPLPDYEHWNGKSGEIVHTARQNGTEKDYAESVYVKIELGNLCKGIQKVRHPLRRIEWYFP